MANSSTTGQSTGKMDGACSCCAPMEERTKRGWEIALPLWTFYKLIHCEACGRFWHRFKEETSHWKEVCADTAHALRQTVLSSQVWTNGRKIDTVQHPAVSAVNVHTDAVGAPEVEDGKIIPISSAAA